MEQDDDGARFRGVQVAASHGGDVSSVHGLAARLDEMKAELLGLAAQSREPGEQLFLGEMVDDWLRVIGPKRVAPENEFYLSQHLLPLFIENEGTLTAAMIEDHFELLKSRLSNSTINKVRNVGRRTIERAISERRWHSPNPFTKTQRLTEGEVEFEELTLDELYRIQKMLRPDRRIQFRVMLHLGLRTGELFALRKQDVDFVNGSITIHRSHARDETKTGKARVLPILPAIAQELAHAMTMAPTDVIFGKAADGELQRHDTKMARVIRTAMMKAGVGFKSIVYKCRHCGSHIELPPPVKVHLCDRCGRKTWAVPKTIPFTWYDLRHMSATLHNRYGADAFTAAVCFGWSLKPFGMKSRYVHPSIEDKRRELSKWELPRSEGEQIEMFVGRANVLPINQRKTIVSQNRPAASAEVDVMKELNDLLSLR